MIITVVGFKGGVGKTTTAINIAAVLAERNNPDQLPEKRAETLLVDDDPNRSSTKWAKRGSLTFSVCGVGAVAKYSKTTVDTIIDTRGHPDDTALEDYAQGCDMLLLPTTPDILAVEALLDTAEAVNKYIEPVVLLTMVDGRKKSDIETARLKLADEGLIVLEQTIRRLSAHNKAAQNGSAVTDVKGSAAKEAWDEYKNVVAEIMGLYSSGKLDRTTDS
ncbi:MAG: ParA family protein [Phormidesmis sp.]